MTKLATKHRKNFLKLISKSSKPIEFNPCNFDELGYLKIHFRSSAAQELPYAFHDKSDHYLLQVELPGFSKEDIKNIKFRRIKEGDGFYFVIEAATQLTPPEIPLMSPTIHYGDLICRTEKIYFAKNEDFDEKSTKEIIDGVLNVRWNKRLRDDETF